MVHGVAVQHRAAQILQRRQGAGLSRTGAAGEAHDQRAVGVDQVEACCLFQSVGHRQPQAAIVGALGEDLGDVRAVKGTQGVKYMAGLGGFVRCRAQLVDDVPREKRGVFVEADNPCCIRQQPLDAAGTALRVPR